MRPLQGLKLTAACLLCLLLTLCAAQAEITVEAALGYENTVTYLTAMPLRVRLRNDGADGDYTVAVNLNRSRNEYDRYEYPVALAGGAEIDLTLPLTISYKQSAYTVEVLEGGEVIASAQAKPQKTVSPDTLLVGLLSDQPQALRYMNISSANDPLMRGENWQTLALTAETFPDDIELMRAFRILAVDGFDIGGLSESSRAVLAQWLREGGIVIVGGGASAAAACKGFAPFTGILPQAPYQAQRVDVALLKTLEGGAFASNEKTHVSGPVLLAELIGAKRPVSELNGKTLIDRCPVDAGVVYTCAFSLSERPLSAWSGMNGFWQRLLLTCDQGMYQRIVNKLQNYYDNDGLYADAWLLRQMPLDNPDSVLLVVAMIAGFIVLSGVGSYFILKKLDKREWMWVTVPALSLISAVLTLTVSGGMQMNKPAAVSYAVMRVDEKGGSETVIMTGVASSGRRDLKIASANGESLRPNSGGLNYYSDDEEQADNVQPRLRFTYTCGDSPAVTVPQASPWDVQLFSMKSSRGVSCPVSASIWWEKDGLHGEIENGSDFVLDPGYVITDLGYCTVPELQPGARQTFAILDNPNREIDPEKGVVYEGELVNEAYANIYTVMEAAIWPEYHGNGRENSDPDRLRLRSLLEACRNGWKEYNVFRYVTFSDQIEHPELLLNGEMVRRAAFDAVIDVAVAYRAVGESGVVRLSRGMIPAYSCELDASKKPVFSSGSPLEAYSYFPLQNEPVLCFALGELGIVSLEDIEIDDVKFTCETYGATPRMWIYNAGKEQWEEVTVGSFPVSIGGDTLRRCLDGEGRLFVRLASTAGRNGNEIYNPALTLEGRIR